MHHMLKAFQCTSTLNLFSDSHPPTPTKRKNPLLSLMGRRLNQAKGSILCLEHPNQIHRYCHCHRPSPRQINQRKKNFLKKAKIK